MQTLQTRYGALPVQGPVERYADGSLRSCLPAGPVVLATSAGEFTPQHSTDELRRKEAQPLCFHPNGVLHCLPLEQSTEVQTPAGTLRAELLTFHDQGALQRVFPLNGRLSGYWTQEDEAALSEVVELQMPWGPLRIRPLSLCFDAQGRWRSLTLWPGERVSAPTVQGAISTRIGISFWEDGAVRSLEPAESTPVPTAVGEIWAFDSDAVGISGDRNSLGFDRAGNVVRVSTVQSVLVVERSQGARVEFAPLERESLCGDSAVEITPMQLEFFAEGVLVRQTAGSSGERVPYSGCTFGTQKRMPKLNLFELRQGCMI